MLAVPPAYAAFPGENGRIAFAGNRDGAATRQGRGVERAGARVTYRLSDTGRTGANGVRSTGRLANFRMQRVTELF